MGRSGKLLRYKNWDTGKFGAQKYGYGIRAIRDEFRMRYDIK